MIDSHTHTRFSHDGKQEMTELFAKAEALGLEYLAVTEHFDAEDAAGYMRPLDVSAYYNRFQEVKSRFHIPKLAFGLELGYSPEAVARYLACPYLYKCDVILNSVHYVDGEDPYFPNYFTSKKDKQEAYNLYYRLVLESLSAAYPYDVVGHIGYICRYAPFEDKEPKGETSDILDEIFKTAIAQDKTVEVNIHTKASGLLAVPNITALRRYRELGGDNVTFSSDAHVTARLAEKYAETAAWVKDLGFRYWTVYLNRKPIKIKID